MLQKGLAEALFVQEHCLAKGFCSLGPSEIQRVKHLLGIFLHRLQIGSDDLESERE